MIEICLNPDNETIGGTVFDAGDVDQLVADAAAALDFSFILGFPELLQKWTISIFAAGMLLFRWLFDRVDLIKPVSNVRPSIRTYVHQYVHKKFFWF